MVLCIVLIKHISLSVNNIEHMCLQNIVYSVEWLYLLRHTLALFGGCRIILPTSSCFQGQICQLPVRRQGWHAHVDSCIRGFVHHIFGEESVTHSWIKFGAFSSNSSPSMYDTSEHLDFSQNWTNQRSSLSNSALAKPAIRVVLVEIPENLGYQQQWL